MSVLAVYKPDVIVGWTMDGDMFVNSANILEFLFIPTRGKSFKHLD